MNPLRGSIARGPIKVLTASLIVLIGVSPAAIAPRAARAQAPGRQVSPPSLQYDVSVVLKLVHVYVTDKKGRPVTDLGRDEFVVRDNGRPIVVSEFETHAFLLPEGAGALADAAPANAAGAPAVRPPNRRFFLFFDFAYNNPRGMLKAKAAALHFLDDDVSPEDEIAILSYSSIKGMAVHEYLTTDHAKIRKVVEGIGLKDMSGRADDLEDLYQRVGEEGPGATGGILPALEANALLTESWMSAKNFVSRMAVLAKAMRFIPGQKQFILFSSGVPGILTRDGGNEARNVDLDELMEVMHRDFAASGCTFFTFDTRPSAMGTSLFGYDERTLESGDRSMFMKGGASQELNSMFLSDKGTGYKSLHSFAKETGGRYYSNIDLFEKNLAQVKATTGTYYVLGYSIDERADGVFHAVDVTVSRKGCQVRTQAGYFAPKPYRDYTDLEKQLHLYDLALNERAFSRLPVTFPMTALPYTSEKDAGLAMLARIPGDVSGLFSGRKVEFISIVFDDQGNVRGVQRLEADPRPHRGRTLVFTAATPLKPGRYACRLVIRDMETGTSAVTSARAAIGQETSGWLGLKSPLLIAEEPGCVYLESSQSSAGWRALWTDAYAFDHLNSCPLSGKVTKREKTVRVIVPYRAPDAESSLMLSAYLIDAATARRPPVAFTLIGRTRTRDIEMATLEFPVDALPIGSYFLYVYFEDRVSGTRSHVQTSFDLVEE
jgi:VWFA-related protein